MSTFHRTHVFGSDERTVTRTEQEFRIDERSEQRITGGPIQPPQALRLRRRQTQSGHFDVFALNTPKDVVKRLMLCGHVDSSTIPVLRWFKGKMSNARATGWGSPSALVDRK